MENSEFSSADLTIAAGTSVTFTNDDAFDHTVSEGVDGELATDALFNLELAAGASGSFTFTDPGTYQVTCTLHPTMNMTITVE
jgi:plastocyanin